MTGAYGYTYTYNAENQLIRIDLSGVEVARYEYDSNGLRTRKITPARTDRYYYDNGELAYVTEENAGASQNKLKYFFARDTLGRLMHMIDYTVATPKTYCYILDVHGNVVALADESGNRVVNYEYDAWGNLTNTPEAVTTGNGEYLRNANPFRYSCYQFDPESGLYYLKARYYTATLGRFLTKDVIISINRYYYAFNNSINLIDPTGSITQAEINAYKAGKLSKQVYNKLMQLTQAYNMSPDKKSRDAVSSLAERYRKGNYKMVIDIQFDSYYLSSKEALSISRRRTAEEYIFVSVVSGVAAGWIGFIGGLILEVGSQSNSLSNVTPGHYQKAVITVKEKYNDVYYTILKGPATSILNGLNINVLYNLIMIVKVEIIRRKLLMYFRNIRLKMSKGKIRFIFIESVLKFMLPFGLAYLIFLGNIEALEPNVDKVGVSIFMRELILTIVVFILIGIIKGSVEWYYIARYLNGDKKGNVKWIRNRFIYLIGFISFGFPFFISGSVIRYSRMINFQSLVMGFVICFLLSIIPGILAWRDAKDSLL